jgi:hypothetical protein
MMLVAAKWREFESQNPSAATTAASTPATAQNDDEDEDEAPRRGTSRSSRARVKKVIEEEVLLPTYS